MYNFNNCNRQTILLPFHQHYIILMYIVLTKPINTTTYADSEIIASQHVGAT